jgi:CubicO group peptidase (beta-lactamase class C family)
MLLALPLPSHEMPTTPSLKSTYAALLPTLIAGCARTPSPPVRPPIAPTSLASAAATLLPPFSPRATDPARKAKLEALAPRLDALLRETLKAGGATGLAVGIVLDGELAYERGFGVRDLVSGDPVDADTVFRIASMTKGFTALAAMKLRDDGRLSLDAPASMYVPELSALVPPTRDAAPITTRLLLTHASGLPYDDLWGAVTFGQGDAELSAFLKTGVSFATVPGERYAYSNLGYALLGKIVASASGMRFRDYVTSRILRPLGMPSTVWEVDDVPPARLATGYAHDGDRMLPEPRPADRAFDAAGGLYTSLRDFARYVAFNLAAYPPRDDAESGPVRRSTLREMHAGQRWTRWGDRDTPVAWEKDGKLRLSAGSYGFGWISLTTCSEEGRVQHGGYEPGYFANAILLPRHGVAFLTLATSAPIGWMSYARTFAILREGGVMSARIDPAPAPDPALVDARSAIDRLVERWDSADAARVFDPSSLGYTWHAHLGDDFAKLASDHGHCRTEGSLEVHGRMHGSWRLACDRGAITFDALLTPANPPRVQAAIWRAELPADPRTARAAARLTAMMDHWDDSVASELLAPAVDRQRARRSLAHLAIDHGSCTVVNGVIETDHQPLANDQRDRFQLACRDGGVDLTFKLDDRAQITEFDTTTPELPDDTCR